MYGGRSAFRLVLAVSVAIGALVAGTGRAAPSPDLDPGLFPLPAVLEPNVGFWSNVYSRYSTDEVALHDDLHLGVVYDILDMSDLERSEMSEGQRRKVRQQRIDEARDRVVATLHRLAKAEPSSSEDERIWKLWSGIGSGRERFAAAAGRVRAQSGLRERFAEGLVIAGRFLPGIERVFDAERVPPVLSRLPFVESMFVSRAQSKVGAVGAWQFMPATARLYLQMNPAVDSRVDTLLAAEGAARMLRHDYEELRSWPLALTAYNHGRAGVARAVREVGSRDIGEIVQKYQSKRFGFASRNFYSEFVAAARVHHQREQHFPGIEPDPELQFEQFELPHFVSLLDLAEATGIGVEPLRDLNPALDGDVFAGTLLVPKSYRLRVPAGEGARFEAAYTALPADRRRDSQLQVGYRVQKGDTLGELARRFGTTVGAIQRANGLSRPDRISVGQYLRIPGQNLDSFAPKPILTAAAPAPASSTGAALATGSGPAAASASTAVSTQALAEATALATGAGTSSYTVRPGDTLVAIARRYGVSIGELAAVNGLLSAHRIFPGQRLTIPAAGAPAAPAPEAVASTVPPAEAARQHVVRRGESLARIARQYSVSVEALRRSNELPSTMIHPGQVLHIP
jgi:membrane-bound lytic murein transglycosylase D